MRIPFIIWLAVIVPAVGGALFSFPSVANAQRYRTVTVGKQCGSCGGSAPINAQIGDTCEHCGVRWGYESQRTTSKPEPVSPPVKRRRVYESNARTQAWKQDLLSRAGAINPNVSRYSGVSPAFSGSGASHNPVQDADAVMRVSRQSRAIVRQLALWVVRHPTEGRLQIPSAYGTGSDLDNLLTEARPLIVRAGLSSSRYRALSW